MTKLLLPLAEMPGVIRESVRTVLKVHHLQLDEPVLDECGRNASQALFSINERREIDVPPSQVYDEFFGRGIPPEHQEMFSDSAAALAREFLLELADKDTRPRPMCHGELVLLACALLRALGGER